MKNKDVIRFILNAPRSAVVYLSICLNLELKDAVDEDAAHWWRLTRPGGGGGVTVGFVYGFFRTT